MRPLSGNISDRQNNDLIKHSVFFDLVTIVDISIMTQSNIHLGGYQLGHLKNLKENYILHSPPQRFF